MSSGLTSISLNGARDLAERAFSAVPGKGTYWTDDATIELPIRLGTTFPANATPITVPAAFSRSVESNYSLPALRVVCAFVFTRHSGLLNQSISNRILNDRNVAANGLSGLMPSTTHLSLAQLAHCFTPRYPSCAFRVRWLVLPCTLV